MSRWLAVLSIVPLVLAAPAAAEEWHRTYDVGSHPELHITTDDGSVEIEPWDRSSISVEVDAPGWRIPSHLKIEDHQDGDLVEIEVRRKWFQFHVDFSERKVMVRVRVPRALDLDVTTGDGPVVVHPVSGDLRIRTGDGPIQVNALNGNIRLATGDGPIEAHDLRGTLVATSGDGPMQVEGRFDGLHLTSGDGKIIAIAAEGSVVGDGWEVLTGDGSVLLRIPEDLRADLDIDTGDGRVTLDVPVEISGQYRRSRIRGTLNGGGPTVRLRSGDGSIRVANL